MASGLASGTALRHLHDLFSGRNGHEALTDGQLLARYTASNDGPAFATLVTRHGPMVAATCRAILQCREHDVEDAFQATFLVLARKARSVRAGDVLGGWLHSRGVSDRGSGEYRVKSEAPRRESGRIADGHPRRGPLCALTLELLSIVHEEIDRLPEPRQLPTGRALRPGGG